MAEEEAVKKAPSGNTRRYTDNVLPMARIKKIMKMDPNITDNITVEANYLVCAAAELFIKHLAKEVYKMDKRCLSYQNLSKFICDDAKLDFLYDVVPKKITVREYKQMMSEESQRKDENSGSEVSTSESTSEEEESDESEEKEKEK